MAAGLVVVLALAMLAIQTIQPPVSGARSLEEYLTGLNWPVALAFAPDGRIFFAERYTGNIRIIEDGTLLPTPLFTLAGTATDGEQGFLGLAIDPDFPDSPWVYAYQTFDDMANGTIYNRIVRIFAVGNEGQYHEAVLDGIPAASYHNGGVISFGPDGKLYAEVGDVQVKANAQNLMTLAGKVLRMNPNGSVPEDNPFYGNDIANPYVYTYGHRNMFGIAFHPFVPTIYASENGPECNDEVNLLEPGRNFGWGPNATCQEPPPPPNNTNRDGPDAVLPLTWFGSSVAPTNAAVYGGPRFPAWQGDLFVGEWITRDLRRIHLNPPGYDTVASEETVVTAPSGILDVEAGPDGAIWFTTSSTIFRFTDTGLPPVATFTFAPDPPLVNASVIFDSSSSSDPDGTILSYDWDFGDGTTGIGMISTHAFSAPGVYNVTLTVHDNESYSASRSKEVRVYAPPDASFSFGPALPLVDEMVTFDATGSSDLDGAIVNYAWVFGDETIGSGVTATHAYVLPGLYAVFLTVTDDDGLSSTAEAPITVAVPVPPVASFIVHPSSPFANESVTFDGTGSTDPDSTIVRFEWEFGDGAGASGSIVSHAYATIGTYQINLTVTDSQGLADLEAQSIRIVATPRASFHYVPAQPSKEENVTFDGSASADPDGSIVSYDWDFGDGTTGSGMIISHAFQRGGVFNVTLRVLDNELYVSSISKEVRVYEAPVASFSFNPLDPLVNETVTFNASSSSDEDGLVVSYQWDWGDGTVLGPPAAPLASHTYGGFGSFVVLLTVIDSDGFTDTEVATLRVYAPPSAVFTVSPPTPVSGETVTFDGSGSTDPDGEILAYAWEFGDGDIATGASASHIFVDSGPHRVNLTVTDGDRLQTMASELISVGKPNEQPAATFSAQPERVNPGEPIAFDGSTSSDPDGTIVLYVWDFGDNSSANGARVVHSYATPGTYVVRLTVTDNNATTDVTATTIRVNAPPVAVIAVSSEGPFLVNVPISMDACGSYDPEGSALEASWDFGDGMASSAWVVNHAYDRKGTFVVTLTVTDDLGATASSSRSIELSNRAPTIASADPGASTVTITTGETFRFTVDALDADGDSLSFVWTVDGTVVLNSGAALDFLEMRAGTYRIEVAVSDGTAGVSREWTVTVEAPPPTAQGAPPSVLILFAIGMLSLAAFTVFLIRRLRLR